SSSVGVALGGRGGVSIGVGYSDSSSGSIGISKVLRVGGGSSIGLILGINCGCLMGTRLSYCCRGSISVGLTGCQIVSLRSRGGIVVDLRGSSDTTIDCVRVVGCEGVENEASTAEEEECCKGNEENART